MYGDLFTDDKVNLDVLRRRGSSMRWGSLPEDVIPMTAADPDFMPATQ